VLKQGGGEESAYVRYDKPSMGVLNCFPTLLREGEKKKSRKRGEKKDKKTGLPRLGNRGKSLIMRVGKKTDHNHRGSLPGEGGGKRGSDRPVSTLQASGGIMTATEKGSQVMVHGRRSTGHARKARVDGLAFGGCGRKGSRRRVQESDLLSPGLALLQSILKGSSIKKKRRHSK